MLKQREMFTESDCVCRECGTVFLPLHPDPLTQAQWDEDDGTLWAQSMGFCQRRCLNAYVHYHEYLSWDEDEEDSR
jgi:hypothetical protein